MGQVVFEDPVDYIRGKISKKKQTVFNHRRGSDRRSTQVRDERKTPPTTTELVVRNRFRICRQAAQQRSMDLSCISKDQMIFLDERKRPGFRYTTYRGWLFGKAWKYFDENTNKVTWPAQL